MTPWSTRNMKNLRSHLLMQKKVLPASKALITSYFLNIKGSLLLLILFPLLEWYVMSTAILCTSAVFFIVDSRSGGTFDMEALRILMPFYFPWFRYQWDILPPHSFMSLPSLKVSCLFSVMTILGSKNIFWKDFWANLSKLGPFLNLKLG